MLNSLLLKFYSWEDFFPPRQASNSNNGALNILESQSIQVLFSKSLETDCLGGILSDPKTLISPMLIRRENINNVPYP